MIWRGKRICPACLSLVTTELREDCRPVERHGTVEHDAERCEVMARFRWNNGKRWRLASVMWEWAT